MGALFTKSFVCCSRFMAGDDGEAAAPVVGSEARAMTTANEVFPLPRSSPKDR